MPLYFDNAATTAMRPEVLAAMMPYLTEQYGNPSGLYAHARAAKTAVETARKQVAAAFNAKPEEIFFTGSGTESDNWALKGVAEAMKAKGKHIITTAIEHHAVLYACQYLEQQGYDVTYLPVDGEGFVSPAALEAEIRPDTFLVSVMLANNEVGVIQPLAELSRVTRKHQVLLHTDAVQAAGHIPIDVETMGLDLLTLAAHKFYGPRGVGALYVRRGTPIKPLLHGGAQESKRRAGTENVAGIVGLAAALTLALEEMDAEAARVTALRNRLIAGIQAAIPHTYLNGSPEKRLPGNVNLSFAFVEGESLLMLLDMKGCYASTGSACTSGSLDPSHVLTAMGNPTGSPHDMANGAVRFTLGRYTTDADVDALLALLPPIVTRLREMSPLYDDFMKIGGNPNGI